MYFNAMSFFPTKNDNVGILVQKIKLLVNRYKKCLINLFIGY